MTNYVWFNFLCIKFISLYKCSKIFFFTELWRKSPLTLQKMPPKKSPKKRKHNYYCCHGNCNSDSRKNPELRFATFPKVSVDGDRAKRWAELMCRRDFTVRNITSNIYVCELHFPEGVDLNYR